MRGQADWERRWPETAEEKTLTRAGARRWAKDGNPVCYQPCGNHERPAVAPWLSIFFLGQSRQ
jgi:hypothetical protein